MIWYIFPVFEGISRAARASESDENLLFQISLLLLRFIQVCFNKFTISATPNNLKTKIAASPQAVCLLSTKNTAQNCRFSTWAEMLRIFIFQIENFFLKKFQFRY